MRKIAAAIAFALIVVSLAGCEGPGLPEEEAAAVVVELVRASYELNVIYYGDGMMSVADIDENYIGFYADILDDEPYLTEAELREATLKVFTNNYSQSIFEMFLTGYSDEDSTEPVYARYIEAGDRLQKKRVYDQLIESERTYDLENITITRSRARTIIATLHSFVDGKPDVDVTVTVRLDERKTDSGTEKVWRLDSPTY